MDPTPERWFAINITWDITDSSGEETFSLKVLPVTHAEAIFIN
jgi:hypothetical protein